MNRSDRNRLSGIFALSLTLSIIFGGYQPIYSQSPSPREALIEEIREDVARQIAIDKPALEDADIEKRYLEKAEAVGITREKLIALYEQEYFDQKQAQRSSPWQKFIPNMGWLVGLVSMAALACTTELQSWLNKQIASIKSWLYGEFLGITLFRNRVSKKYRAALKKNYEQLPMPFLKNRNHLKMEDVYIPLNISDDEQKKHKNDIENTTSPEIMDVYAAIAKHERLIVTGEPGSGKSVLLKYLAWSYGSDKLNGLSNRPIVILLELYRLSDGSLDEAKLLEELVKTFDRNQFPNAQQFVLQGLKNGLFLLLFDGLDEVNSDVRGHVSNVIRDFLQKYEQCRVVITCRKTVYNEEFSDIVKRKLKVAEFTNQQIRQFLKFWEPEMRQAGKSIKQMMKDIEERPLILKLAHNPLLLTLIAYLYTESDFVLPRSRAELYQRSASILLKERQYKSHDGSEYSECEADDKRRILERLALHVQENSSNKDLRSITLGAAREQARTTLRDVGLPQENAREILNEIVERSGLFIKGKDKISGEEYYIFSHSTIQEYFAAAALKEREMELIEQYSANPTAWQEVVKLWCSLANESTNVVKTVYRQDPLTGFECLAEARQINPDLVNQIIDYFKPELNELQPNDTLVQTFGTVAASKDEPGTAVFNFLVFKLYNKGDTSDVFQNAVADALSRTNLPKAADRLVDGWEGRREPIVRMGDVAVPALKKKADRAKLQAQDDLYRIRTPDAIDALVPLLWHTEEFVANQAAQFLGKLLFQADIKEVLRNYELTIQQRESEIIDWIWQPFDKEPSHSSLPTIAGRIAYLLKKMPSVQRDREVLPDPRLVVPICAVESPINSLPDHIPATVEVLLKHTDGFTEANYISASDNLLANISTSDQHWKQLLRMLPPILELDLLSRLIAQRQQHQYNYRRYWQDLFKPVDYELSTGWHYRSIITLAAVISIFAISKVGFSIFTDPENPFFIASAVIVIYINLIFWVTLHQSDNKNLTPDLFWGLGPKGIYTYTQCIQLYRKGLTWPFVDNLYRAISNRRVSFIVVITSGITFIVRAISMFVVSHNTVAGAEFGIINGILGGVFLMAGTLIVTAFIFAIVTISVALIVFVLISGAVAIAIAIKGGEVREKAMVGARLANYAIESFLTGAGDASVITTASLATGIATGAIATAIDFEINFPIAIAGVIVGVGIGAWCQAKITPKNLWLRFLAVLSFPYFCWFPLTATFSTWAIYDSLAIMSPLSFPLWQQTSTVLSVITGLCAVLWWRGKWLDTRAKNPFHGGALGKALGVNQ